MMLRSAERPVLPSSAIDSNMRDADYVVFGASGFTGRWVAVSFVRRVLKEQTKKILLLAGRSRSRLEQVRDFCAVQLMVERAEIEAITDIVTADVLDKASLIGMASRARMVVNCVGPYRLHGEAVVQACISSKTHYVDLSGEPEYMEMIELNYQDAAREAGILVVSGVGFDCIPAEVGVAYAVEEVMKECGKGGSPVWVESFLVLGGITRGSANFATFESAVLGYASATAGGLQNTRRQLQQRRRLQRLPLDPRIPKLHLMRTLFGKIDSRCPEGTHVVPFPGADASVVRRSQWLLAEQLADHEQEIAKSKVGHLHRPTQYAAYIVINKGYRLQAVIAFAMMSILARFRLGIWLLLNFPGFFTFGIFTNRGQAPSDNERRGGGAFQMNIYALGASEKAMNGITEDDHVVPDVSRYVRISGTDPGYECTGKFCCTAASCILENIDRRSPLRLRTGVVTPATALRTTDIVKRLRAGGIEIEVIDRTGQLPLARCRGVNFV